MATALNSNNGVVVGNLQKRSYALRFRTDVPEQAVAQAIQCFNAKLQVRTDGEGFIWTRPEFEYDDDSGDLIECYHLYADEACWHAFRRRGEAIVVDHVLMEYGVAHAS